jgi:hypothetical protein
MFLTQLLYNVVTLSVTCKFSSVVTASTSDLRNCELYDYLVLVNLCFLVNLCNRLKCACIYIYKLYCSHLFHIL